MLWDMNAWDPEMKKEEAETEGEHWPGRVPQAWA